MPASQPIQAAPSQHVNSCKARLQKPSEAATCNIPILSGHHVLCGKPTSRAHLSNSEALPLCTALHPAAAPRPAAPTQPSQPHLTMQTLPVSLAAMDGTAVPQVKGKAHAAAVGTGRQPVCDLQLVEIALGCVNTELQARAVLCQHHPSAVHLHRQLPKRREAKEGHVSANAAQSNTRGTCTVGCQRGWHVRCSPCLIHPTQMQIRQSPLPASLSVLRLLLCVPSLR